MIGTLIGIAATSAALCALRCARLRIRDLQNELADQRTRFDKLNTLNGKLSVNNACLRHANVLGQPHGDARTLLTSAASDTLAANHRPGALAGISTGARTIERAAFPELN